MEAAGDWSIIRMFGKFSVRVGSCVSREGREGVQARGRMLLSSSSCLPPSRLSWTWGRGGEGDVGQGGAKEGEVGLGRVKDEEEAPGPWLITESNRGDGREL